MILKSTLGLALAISVGLHANHAAAEVEKIAIPNDDGLRTIWWPRLPTVGAWQHDQDASVHYAINAMVPNGSSFADAPAVIYGKAIYKPRTPETHSLLQFIASDKEEFVQHTPDISVKAAGEMKTADGRKLTVVDYTPQTRGSWERVAYFEEGDFYMVLALSATSKAEWEKALPSFRKLVAAYREKP